MTRPPAAVATFGQLADLQAKMGHGIARFCEHIVAVIDAAHAGKRADQVVPYIGRPIPVVAGLDEACALGAEEVVLGGSPPGGGSTAAVFPFVRDVLDRGMWLVSGLHERLADRFPSAERLIDLRHLPVEDRIGSGKAAELEASVLLTVGSDCASGKMTTVLEIERMLRGRRRTAVVATGQTGMYITGSGRAVDAVKADFLAGVVEHEVMKAAEADLILVEGQGSLFHPAYSGVALGLMHGAAPDKLVFCHDLSRTRLAYFGQAIGDLGEQIALTQALAARLRPAEVVAVSVMFDADLRIDEARRHMARIESDLGLPVVSPRLGLEPLADRLVAR
ncbi:DUF1611 domain-containing protein [Glycomyces luteolus]|uniref:DUF1611 domain-containing protein n=1 Tax=Glycomyces luteolus TaxID=2670330 RepID=A0A9X3SUZ6_9ACTN|nr:DUF1611 domain-containing protein [Glycomyces luteolus]MDA1361858.1 DUF1611 domain-containing protein [Glycomyces luteolus]